jgi:hypothetical protein
MYGCISNWHTAPYAYTPLHVAAHQPFPPSTDTIAPSFYTGHIQQLTRHSELHLGYWLRWQLRPMSPNAAAAAAAAAEECDYLVKTARPRLRASGVSDSITGERTLHSTGPTGQHAQRATHSQHNNSTAPELP